MRRTSSSCAPLAWLAVACVLATGCDDAEAPAPAPECIPSGAETCNDVDDDCNGVVDDQIYDSDTNPACSTGETYFVSGDGGADDNQLSTSGTTERWFRVRFREDASASRDIFGALSLFGRAFELYVYCEACGGTLVAYAPSGSSANLQATDHSMQSDGFNVLVEVRFRDVGEGYCAGWTVDVAGGWHVNREDNPPVTCG